MNTVFNWLNEHKIAAIVVILLYASATIFPHDVLQNPALRMQQQTGMVVWHFGLLILIAACLLGVGGAVLRSNQIQEELAASRYTAIGVSALLVTGSAFLMVNSVEHIHYLQYLILVLILSPVFGNLGLAVMVAIFTGAFDEAYQYFVLHPQQPYFDFNDVVLNGFGAATGGLIYGLLARRKTDHSKTKRELAPSWHLTAWFGIFSMVILLFATGYLGSFVDTGQVALNRYPKPEVYGLTQRWIDTGWGNHWFKLEPYEGLTIVFLIPFLFGRSFLKRS